MCCREKGQYFLRLPLEIKSQTELLIFIIKTAKDTVMWTNYSSLVFEIWPQKENGIRTTQKVREDKQIWSQSECLFS